MPSALISGYLARGLAAARPVTPDVAAGVTSFYYATDTSVLSVWDGAAWDTVGGGGGGGSFSGALVHRTTDLTAQNYVPGAVIDWQAEDYDVGNWYDVGTSASRLVVPTGVTRVVVSAQIRLDLLTTTNGLFVNIRKNGSEIYRGVGQSIGSAGGYSTNTQNLSSPVLSVVAGDFFDVIVRVSSDTSTTFTQADSWFSIRAIS